MNYESKFFCECEIYFYDILIKEYNFCNVMKEKRSV